jgi:8-oxo-dGTP pyrophosphatase MutT (NUDIX family)
MKKLMTLVMIYNDEQILLALKKRGFGMGRWNGYGGKIDEGETVEEAAKRELLEESGLVVKELQNRGQLTFTFEDNHDKEFEVHLFQAKEYDGDPIETEEMKPQWFAHAEIPYSEMWTSDRLWISHLLDGKHVRGAVHFDNPESQNILTKNIIAEYE